MKIIIINCNTPMRERERERERELILEVFDPNFTTTGGLDLL